MAILHGGGDAERFSIRDDSTILTALRAARAALASCASDVEATALVAPAAAEAAREAIHTLARARNGAPKRWAKKTSRLIGSVALRVARRAPRAVARDTLPPLFRDALAGAATGDVESESESESESEIESDAPDDASGRRVRRRPVDGSEEEEDDFFARRFAPRNASPGGFARSSRRARRRFLRRVHSRRARVRVLAPGRLGENRSRRRRGVGSRGEPEARPRFRWRFARFFQRV